MLDCRLEVCHIVEANWADLSAYDQDLIISGCAHRSDFRFSPEDPWRLICCIVIDDNQMHSIVVMSRTQNLIGNCAFRLRPRFKNMNACDSLYSCTLLQCAQHHEYLFRELICLIEFNWSGGLSCFTVLEKQLFVFFNHLLYDWARFHHEFFQL